MGEEYDTIEYGVTSKNILNYAVFVALCVSDDMALSAPDNGYTSGNRRVYYLF